jgi:hypothetical protein
MLSNWKHAVSMMSCILLVSAPLAHPQVRSSVSESFFKKMISSYGRFIEVAGRVRLTFPGGFLPHREASQSDYELTIMLPSDYLLQVPSNLKPTAFREVLHGSPLELNYHYEKVATELDIKYRRLRVKVPKLSFYRLEQLYDTIVVGCVPR